jgi:hypothetical protein
VLNIVVVMGDVIASVYTFHSPDLTHATGCKNQKLSHKHIETKYVTAQFLAESTTLQLTNTWCYDTLFETI